MNSSQKIRSLAEGGIMLALAVILSIVTIFKMPFGGAVTLFSMLPIAIYAYRYHTSQALVVAILFAITQMLIGFENFAFVKEDKPEDIISSVFLRYIIVFLFDYLLAFGVLGFSGMFKKMKKTSAILIASGSVLFLTVVFTISIVTGTGAAEKFNEDDTVFYQDMLRKLWIIAIEAVVIITLTILALVFQKKATASSVAIASGIAVTGVLRFICHFISGVTVFRAYAENTTATYYSLYYNLSYMLPEIVLTVLMAAVISNLLNFDAEVMDVIWKDDSKVKKLWDDESK